MDENSVNSTAETSGTATRSTAQPESLLHKWVRDGGEVMLDVGKLLGRAAEDLTGLMVLRVEKEKRAQLDLLVESGVVKTRAQGLKMLAEIGAKSKEQVFRRVETTREQIAALKKGLKDLAGIPGKSSG